MTDTQPLARATLGWSGFAVGAGALILTLVTFWAGPFGAQQSGGVSIGELAAEIAKSAARSVAGQPQPAPVRPVQTIDDYLNIAVAVMTGIAIVLGIAAMIRHEQKRAALSGIALGVLAVSIQLFTYTVMMFAGALVVFAVVYALRDTFGDIFGGLFGN